MSPPLTEAKILPLRKRQNVHSCSIDQSIYFQNIASGYNYPQKKLLNEAILMYHIFVS